MLVQVRRAEDSLPGRACMHISAQELHCRLLVCHCSFSLGLPKRLAPQTRKLFLARHHFYQVLLLLAFQLLSTLVLFQVRCTHTSGTHHHVLNASHCVVAVAEYNTTFKISRAQLAVSKPAPFGFSLPLDLCLLGVGLCGTTLRGSRTQPSPVPFLLPNFAPQVIITHPPPSFPVL